MRNVPSGVEIEIEGSGARLREFRHRLQAELPPAAAIERIESERLPLRSDTDFCAMPSERGRAATTIPPDLAACAECVREILDPADRRYRYPFTNCTSCGPRFTVVRALPYDRENTTLRDFPLCDQCRSEYLDPSNRRFRAEPIACPRVRSPSMARSDSAAMENRAAGEDCIARAAAILRAGGIVAVQGIGGVHLACDATSEAAVARLRTIKRRAHKPLRRDGRFNRDGAKPRRGLRGRSCVADVAAGGDRPAAQGVPMPNSHSRSRQVMTTSE